MKPGYSTLYVERLYDMCSKYISYEFKFNCLTDGPSRIENNIQYHNIEKFELDTWWNKLLIFHSDYSSDDINLYFDLDLKINSNIDTLVDDIEKDLLCVVDTPWKDDKFFERARYRNTLSLVHYGNSSVMGWIGKSQHYIYKNFEENIFEILKSHYGDDGYINGFARVKYFKDIMGFSDVKNKVITLNHKNLE